MKSTINVTIPVYNREQFVERALQNALTLDYPRKTITVIDDGSDDGTEDIMKQFAGTAGLTYIKLGSNIGADSARNISILLSQYDYITFHDSDDIYDSRKLRLQLERLKKEASAVVFCQCVYLDRKSQIFVRGNKIRLLQDLYPNVVFENRFEKYIFINPGLFKREIFEKIGGFRAGRVGGDDYMQYQVMTAGFKVSFIEQPLILKLDQADSLMATDKDLVNPDRTKALYEQLHKDVDEMRKDPSRACLPLSFPTDLKITTVFAAKENQPKIAANIPADEHVHEIFKEYA